MHDNHDARWTDRERDMLRSLPREDAVPPDEATRILAVFRTESQPRRRRAWTIPLQVAAAVAFLVVGGLAGARIARRHSLEAALDRTDLSLSDRVLLLQRAGSAYVRAAERYTDASVRTDSTAIQVATQVLIGAASAVARHHLDGGFSAQLTSVLASAEAQNASRRQSNIIWY